MNWNKIDPVNIETWPPFDKNVIVYNHPKDKANGESREAILIRLELTSKGATAFWRLPNDAEYHEQTFNITHWGIPEPPSNS